MEDPASPDLPASGFTPVPRHARHDGWTPDLQRQFIATLAATGSVTDAAAQCGMSRASAYMLRTAPGAGEFVTAWDAAVANSIAVLKAVAFDRAIHGVTVQVWHGGEVVGERQVYDNRLLSRLLTIYDQQPVPASASETARLAAPPEPPPPTEADRVATIIAEERATRINRDIILFGIAQSMRLWLKNGGIEYRIRVFEREAYENKHIEPTELEELKRTSGTLGWYEPWEAEADEAARIERETTLARWARGAAAQAEGTAAADG